ncbi:myb-like DNA-binding protein [Achlya hypogyna]|uniref:Myb-like DNA-binding protein n=1 Tax=Achlya hypogyna TaxID=1202772 RepID=A0A1V9ZSD4_ACHHY|nr:myb-like DNA-binding protein [Achlya hypogyna]
MSAPKRTRPAELDNDELPTASSEQRPRQEAEGEDNAPVSSRWTREQDEQLKSGIEKYGTKNWKAIASMVPGRNHAQCLQRWNKVLKPGLVKGHWSFDEDDALIKLVRNATTINWADISKQVPGRTAKQCRERWKNHLDPTINKGPYKSDEDLVLMNAYQELGNRWTQIAELLPGRTEDSVKMRWKVLNPHAKSKAKPGRPPLIAPPASPLKPLSTPPSATTPEAVTDGSTLGLEDEDEDDDETKQILSRRTSSLLESFRTHDSLLSFTSLKADDWEVFQELMMSDHFASAVTARAPTELASVFDSFKDKSMTDDEFHKLVGVIENPEAIMDFIQETYESAGSEWDVACSCGCGDALHNEPSLTHLVPPPPVFSSEPVAFDTYGSYQPHVQASSLHEYVDDVDEVEDLMTAFHVGKRSSRR